MTKILLLIALLVIILCCQSYSQKRYGYAVLHLRCGKEDPEKNRLYYSPVIELNILNFDKYTDGVDPAFPKYSVSYYKYAIARWFELLLKEKYQIWITDPEKYERNVTTVVFDDKNNGDCKDGKTNTGCFFTDKQKLTTKRTNDISESNSPQNNHMICEVIAL